MTNEEAIKHLRDVFYADLTQEQREAVYVAVAALERDRWISVKEKLPEDDCDCIVFSDGYVKEANFFYGKFYDPIEGYMQYKATHWMPLPEPPKEEI